MSKELKLWDGRLRVVRMHTCLKFVTEDQQIIIFNDDLEKLKKLLDE